MFTNYLMRLFPLRALMKDQERNNPQNIKTYLVGINSYFAYYDIDIIPSKFKRKVKIPKTLKEKEEPIDRSQILEKSYCHAIIVGLRHISLILASGGLRAVEGCAIRIKDINFKGARP